jgi:hypothetical protein
MIVIPMLGKSSRFFDSGYSLPKYQLPIGSKTVFELSVRSFESLFLNIPFIFLVRSDFGAKEFVSGELEKLGIKDFRVIEFATETHEELLYNKDRLLRNGDIWEQELAKKLKDDYPYR